MYCPPLLTNCKEESFGSCLKGMNLELYTGKDFAGSKPRFWHMKNSCQARPQNEKMQNGGVLFISGDCEQLL